MANKDNQNAESSAKNKQTDQAAIAKNVREAAPLNKYQQLKNYESRLIEEKKKIDKYKKVVRDWYKAQNNKIAKEKAGLNNKRVELEERELQAQNNFPELFEERFATLIRQLKQREARLGREYESLEDEKEKLRKQKQEVQKAEIQRDKGYADERAKHDDELFSLRKKQEEELALKRAKHDDELFSLRKKQEEELALKRATDLTAIEKELSEKRTSGMASLEKEVGEKRKEQLRLLAEEKKQKYAVLETEIAEQEEMLKQKYAVLEAETAKQEEMLKQKYAVLESETAEREEMLKQKRVESEAEITKKKEDLNRKKAELDEFKAELEFKERRLQSRKDSLKEREDNLDLEIEGKIAERKQSFEEEESRLKDEIARLRDSIKTSSALISNFEELKHRLGDEDPATVLLKLNTYKEDIKELREELATRPTQEMQEAFDRLKSEQSELQLACERLSEENVNLRKSAREQSNLEMQIDELKDEKKSLSRRFESVDADNNRLMEELKRLQSSYEREQDREARIRDIETPYIQKELPRAVDEVEELQWLDHISKSCIDYGLRFPRRILHAFHTALKTSEWSPITVLAGVSGTGKSELPRLYSHFGGINFLSLSVQPNWDSQESMLGFFNSIDNKFDAQPVLRLLAQSQRAQAEDYPLGLEDVMSLILMDEMNLAHVELYFAEFLSKLELRRGCKGNEVPNLEVKLGAGIQHYDLPLGRNVLWAGTMNQDETTKSLSDKVLDRGIVITFPRPTTLERRRQLKPLGDQAELLSRKLWESWWCKESKFKDDQIMPFKGFIEEMNISLSKVGRALGHRVWQSIEYYMSNYPDVLEAQRNNDDAGLAKAMKVAFEDQLVQKVMPKLRGIETRGASRTGCLDKIEVQIKEGIKEYTKKDGTICKPRSAAKGAFSIGDDYKLAMEMGYGQFIWNSANYLKDNQGDEEEGENNNDALKLQEIPEELKKYKEKEKKQYKELTRSEIKKVLNCTGKEVNQIKAICNEIQEL